MPNDKTDSVWRPSSLDVLSPVAQFTHKAEHIIKATGVIPSRTSLGPNLLVNDSPFLFECRANRLFV